jgi:DNA invertase Pin-like site-specific DNA recombinase
MKVGYARVNTRGDHKLDVQRAALEAAGCETVVEEVASGVSSDRPVLSRLVDSLQPGDVLVVWRADRLSRSMAHFMETLAKVKEQGASVYCIATGTDMTEAKQ